MDGFIKILLLLAYVCYVHHYVELQIAKSFSNSNTQVFISYTILFAICYFIFSISN